MANGGDPIDWLKRLAESSTRIRLAPGVIGKSSYINIGIAIVWAIVALRLSANLYEDAALFVVGIIATVWGRNECAKMRQYAVDHPHLALMEGADITEHQKFEAQQKYAPAVTSQPSLSIEPGKTEPQTIGGPVEPERDV